MTERGRALGLGPKGAASWLLRNSKALRDPLGSKFHVKKGPEGMIGPQFPCQNER